MRWRRIALFTFFFILHSQFAIRNSLANELTVDKRSITLTDSLTITLLSDPDRSVMKQYGAFGEKKLYGKTVEGVIRSTVVVDEDGKVFLAQYNVKATGHVAKLRRDLDV